MNFFHGSGCPNAPVAVPTMPRYPFEKLPLMFGPNIIGQSPAGEHNSEGYGGALYFKGTTKGDTAGGGSVDQLLGLDASKSNPLYGASNTVQPASLRGLACIKL